MRGGQGDDLVEGGTGDDWLWGYRGSDTLTGGAGADIFHFGPGMGFDRITDFDGAAGDSIKWDTNSVIYSATSAGGNTTISFSGGEQIVLVGVSSFNQSWLVLSG